MGTQEDSIEDAIKDLLEFSDKRPHLTKGKELADVLIGRACLTADDEWALAAAMKRLLEQELARCRKNARINRQVVESVVEYDEILKKDLQSQDDPELRSWSILWIRYIGHLSVKKIVIVHRAATGPPDCIDLTDVPTRGILVAWIVICHLLVSVSP